MAPSTIGSYRVVRKLGEGGMGTVYLGEHVLLGRPAAIKVLHPHLTLQPEIVQRFFNEARAASAIADPGIVQIFDFGHADDGSAYLVMELFDGESLDHRLEQRGRLHWSEALRLARQLATSLAAAHAHGIIHRDLKPDNIFLVRDVEVTGGERAKILDFGIAKLADERAGGFKTRAGIVLGTPPYMSPEQCRGAADVDARSDIYSLGCVMFHLVTGRPPFDLTGFGELCAAHLMQPPPRPSALVPELPPEVDAVILRCLEKLPEARFSSMTELAAAITQVLPGAAPVLAPSLHVPAAQGEPTPMSLYRTPPSGGPRPVTTLGGSAGQAAPTPTLPAMSPRKLTGLIAGAALLAAAVVVIATRAVRPADVAPEVAGTASSRTRIADASVSPDAAPTDAAGSAAPIDATIDAPADAANDATPTDAAPVPRPPRRPAVRPSAAGSNTSSPACDRTVDYDCDGIPDVR